jgi:glycosidase
MIPRRLFALLLFAALLVAVGSSVAACGSDATKNKDYGEPPDAAAFDPGKGGNGDGYGSGGNDAGEPPVPPAGVFDWRDAVIYFVFVDRFFDGNPGNNCNVGAADGPGNYQGGDWSGVTQKINANYFNDLGVNTLWITVPLQNADTVAGNGTGGDTHKYSAYHGYWPKEPDKPEGCFGTMQELKDLVTAAHAKKLKVLFDYAMVHVHISSTIWAQHQDWFWPNSYNGGDCICGQNCSWDTQYERCWFTDYLPHWNYTNAAARDFSVANAVWWVKETGIDGYRLDAIKHVDTTWLTQVRSQIDAQILAAQTPKQRFYMVGETYDFENRGFIKGFVDPQTKLDGQFDFPLRKRIAEAVLMRKYTGMNDLAGYMDGNDAFYGSTAVMSTFIGNHDLPRIIHLAEDNPRWTDQGSDGKNLAWSGQPGSPGNRAPYERVANAFGVLLTNKGAPLLYYGDEIGLPGAGDPDNRRFMKWAAPSADEAYLKDRIKKLSDIRTAHPALRRGRRATLGTPSADLWAYSMTTTGDTVYVAINRGDTDQSTGALPAGALTELVTGATATGPNATIPPRQTRIFVVK